MPFVTSTKILWIINFHGIDMQLILSCNINIMEMNDIVWQCGGYSIYNYSMGGKFWVIASKQYLHIIIIYKNCNTYIALPNWTSRAPPWVIEHILSNWNWFSWQQKSKTTIYACKGVYGGGEDDLFGELDILIITLWMHIEINILIG